MGSAITGAADIQIKYIWESFLQFCNTQSMQCSSKWILLVSLWNSCSPVRHVTGIMGAAGGEFKLLTVLWRGGFDVQGFSLLPQCFMSVRESPSYLGLGLLIKTQALAEAKQPAVSSCSGVCIRHCLTGSISGEEIYILSSVFATEHLWLRRQMTHLILVKCPREKPGGARHILTLTSSSPL